MADNQSRKISLDVVTIQSPCQVPWDEMHGDHNIRFCKHCNQNVYNISAMTREAAEGLINSTEGRLCVRYFVRPDETIITADCAVKPMRFARSRRFASAALAMIGLSTLAAFVTGVKAQDPQKGIMGGLPPRIEIEKLGEAVPATRPAKPPVVAPENPPAKTPETKPTDPPATPPAKPPVEVQGKVLIDRIRDMEMKGRIDCAN